MRIKNEQWIWIVLAIIFISSIFDSDDPPVNEEPTAAQQQTQVEATYSGVVERLIPTANDATIVSFEGFQIEMYLGDHEVHVGEWNEFRLNEEKHVQEVWYGENAIQDSLSK